MLTVVEAPQALSTLTIQFFFALLTMVDVASHGSRMPVPSEP